MTNAPSLAPSGQGAPAGGPAPVPMTILGNTAMRFPEGGRIRAGIMVLTRKAEANSIARRLYEEGVASGKAFETIEREIQAAVPDLADCLRPKNAPYFTVRGGDFPNPHIARAIMERYAENRGEGLQLYRFPVVFPADAWQNVMPHELVTWRSKHKEYWSEYLADGTRVCKMYEPVQRDGKGKRARLFSGRKIMLRPERGGRCEPEQCPQFQADECNLSGRFIFFIPGIESLAPFALPTRSFYAMQGAIQRFQAIAFMRGGRVSGYLDAREGRTFWLSKRLLEVPRIDGDGKPTRVRQWIIELEAPIDVTRLLRRDDNVDAIEQRAASAAALLQGQPTVSECANQAAPAVQQIAHSAAAQDFAQQMAAQAMERQRGGLQPLGRPEPGGNTAPPAATRESVQVMRAAEAAAPARTADVAAAASEATGAGAVAGADVEHLYAQAGQLGVARDRFEQYAAKRFGAGWAKAAGGRKRVADELQAFAANAEGFRKRVEAEVDTFS